MNEIKVTEDFQPQNWYPYFSESGELYLKIKYDSGLELNIKVLPRNFKFLVKKFPEFTTGEKYNEQEHYS